MYICSLAAFIERNIKSDANYREMEKSIGFSYRHMRDIFQRTTGISLSRYILARKIANAAFEIRHSEKSITEIAFEYEFSNMDTFTRAFKRSTGLRPSEFRKSEHLCGRRIICPGVFGPVILGLDNPRFTLPKSTEVNEMGEMVKTSNSCILYGVPKVYYWRELDGHIQATPFPMCLQSVLNYMGQNISYAQIMAFSGAAFRLRWGLIDGGWDLAAVDIRNTYYEHLKPFELAFKAAGRSFKIVDEADKAKSKELYLELIKSELDCGRPVIALGVVGPPEACIVTGYKNHGETLLGWSLFQGGSGFANDFTIDESGYFLKDRWWENTQGLMSIGEEIGECASAKEVLENALFLMTQEKLEVYEGRFGFAYYGGQAAYEGWAKAIEDDGAFTEGTNLPDRVYCHGDAEAMLGEGRDFAASYMCMLAEQDPALAADFKECARLLGAASACVPKMREARGGLHVNEIVLEKFRQKQCRREIAALIRQAAQYEKDACAVLKGIIDKL
jgi:AraC-like DNA-binding protein